MISPNPDLQRNSKDDEMRNFWGGFLHVQALSLSRGFQIFTHTRNITKSSVPVNKEIFHFHELYSVLQFDL